MSLQMGNNIMLSVCMISYNHEKFIRVAIESVIRQKTDFNIELVIGEDFSEDNTRMICQEYAERYPRLIRLLNTEKNLGVIPNFIRTLEACTGKYMALCEGDDFWIDPYKLQKQVDFLEANPDYSLCFHDALVYWENKNNPPYYFCKDLSKTTYHIEDMIDHWFIPSASMVFRKDLLFPLPAWFNQIYNGDYALQLLLAPKGKFYFINELMSMYRQHETNLTATVDTSQIKKSVIRLFDFYDEYTDHEYSKLIKRKLKKLYRSSRFYRLKNFFVRSAIGKKIWKMSSFIFRLIKNN